MTFRFNELPAVELRQPAHCYPIELVAAEIGIEAKRLRGFIFRNDLDDPIGDATHVMWGSCRRLASLRCAAP